MPCFCAVVCYLLFKNERVTIRRKAIAFLNGHARAIGPAKRYNEIATTADNIALLFGGEGRPMVRLRTVGRRAQARLYEANLVGVRREQLDEVVWPVFGHRVVAQNRALDGAALRTYLNVEHVCFYVNGRRLRNGVAFRCHLKAGLHIRCVDVGACQLRQRVAGRFSRWLFRRGRRFCQLWAVVEHPCLVAKPGHHAEQGPCEKSLVIHVLLFLSALPAHCLLAPVPVSCQAVEQLFVPGRTRGRLVDDYDIQSSQRGLMMPERLPDNTLNSVSVRCEPTVLFGYRQAQPGDVHVVASG